MAALPVVQGKQVTWLELCKRVLGPSASNVKTQPAGSLWGGYGSVTRISVDVDGTTHKLVAKQVGSSLLSLLLVFLLNVVVVCLDLIICCWRVSLGDHWSIQADSSARPNFKEFGVSIVADINIDDAYLQTGMLQSEVGIADTLCCDQTSHCSSSCCHCHHRSTHQPAQASVMNARSSHML